MDEQDERWIAREEALQRLGVKIQTLYAYVSRGRIAARPHPADPRRSLYAANDVARLTGAPGAAATLFHPGAAAGRGEAEIRSSQSVIADGRLFYRGLDAVQLSQSATMEDLARRLWDARDVNPFANLKPRVTAALGPSPRARLMQALARRADEDAGRTPGDLIAEAASVLDEAVDAAAGPGPRLRLHQRLVRGWRAPESEGDLIRRAIVLAADTPDGPAITATRAAAAGGAGLAGSLLAGVATLTGAASTREVARASDYVIQARRDPAGAARQVIARGERFGYGDARFPKGDPRAAALLDAGALPSDWARVVQAGAEATGQAPALPIALAAVARKADLPKDGAHDLWLVARMVGLLGHALDQTRDGSPMRARVRYVGPGPGAH
ncbi:hypothetical protein ASG17_00285 [Brevundimonas sp. Leaf363]|uniref:citrate/2-methylcitrate synthase n=1 Tax=Brevundimonas sp. Leaf363 TaxID=1736353 RepID=UPI0006FB7D89|nr:citrate/2-methylcitrate synthase [Brevundimonas sp. Leaf363]KQS57216.1 hypothetical protein ASG17_00285 [Brevundimonas sp. Leaf363]